MSIANNKAFLAQLNQSNAHGKTNSLSLFSPTLSDLQIPTLAFALCLAAFMLGLSVSSNLSVCGHAIDALVTQPLFSL